MSSPSSQSPAYAKWAEAYATPNGEGDARPSALQVIREEGVTGRWTNKVVLITGASSGIGIEVARALHETGAHLFLAVRDTQKAQHVVHDIAQHSPSTGKIELLTLDLSSLQSVRRCATDFLGQGCQLNVLILNAGIGPGVFERTKDGFEARFGINHVGHFLLFQLLKEALLSSARADFHSRVIVVSAGSHAKSPIMFDDLDLARAGYEPWQAYAQSKTANIYMANEIERRYASQGLHALSLAPGLVWTAMALALPADFQAAVRASPQLAKYCKTAQQGAATAVWATVAREWEGKGGQYLLDMSAAKAASAADPMMAAGYAPHAFDEQAAKRLWEETLQMVYLPKSD